MAGPQHKPSRFSYCLTVLCGLIAGCGQAGFVPATGTVTLNGAPLADVNVSFIPESEGEPAYGTTNAEGIFALTTRLAQGARAGSYHVLVTPATRPGSARGSAKPQTRTTEQKGAAIPSIYASKATSPLIVTLPHQEPILLELEAETH